MSDFESDQMNFPVERASRYNGRYPRYEFPFEIGCFSIDAEGKYHNDGHQLKYLSMPKKLTDLSMDLNDGFREYIHVFEESDYAYSAILKWILSHQRVIRRQFTEGFNSSPEIDFIFFRGALTAVGSTIYENREDWMIYATKFRSVIYLCEIQTERKLEAEDAGGEKQILMTTWGFKFEQYMVSDDVSSEPDTSVPVNENEKYFSVLKGKLGHHRLLFAAEMDGVDPEQLNAPRCDPKSPLRYVELKTSRIITSERQDRNFRRYKLLKWYLQSYFGGVPRVICGFRNDGGVVRELEIFDVKDMPDQADGLWSKGACLNFTSHFLDHVKECVVKDEVVYEFYFEPGSGVITCEELEPDIAFLPEFYTDTVTVI